MSLRRGVISLILAQALSVLAPFTLFSQQPDSVVTQLDSGVLVEYLLDAGSLVQVDTVIGVPFSRHPVRTIASLDSLRNLNRLLHGDYPRPPVIPPSSQEAVGAIPLKSSVSPTGARLCSIPIVTASGCKNVPSISLSYNSQSGNGCAGFGWSLSGLSSITVRGKNLFYDSAISSARYDDTSAEYALDGIPLKSSSLIPNYGLETIRGHIQISRHNLPDGRAGYFTALFPDGSTAVYGFANATEPDYIYPLTVHTDKYGNAVNYNYEHYGGTYYLSTVTYGGGSIMFFDYESHSDAFPYRYSIAGREVNGTGRLLKTIRSYDGNAPIARYSLTHQLKDGVQMLTEIGCSSGTSSLRPLSFSYGMPDESDDESFHCIDSTILSNAYITRIAYNYIFKRGRLLPGRFDEALLCYPDRETYTRLAHFDFLGFLPADSYGSRYPSDDKIVCRPDITIPGDAFEIETGDGFQSVESVDINGDGTDEVVKLNCIGEEGPVTRFTVTVYSFSSAVTMSSRSFSFTLNDGSSNWKYNNPAKCSYRYGRFRGDGKYMLLVLSNDSSKLAVVDLVSEVKCYEGSLFTISDQSIWNILIADFENDGKDDVCVTGPSGIAVYSFNGSQLAYRTSYSGAETILTEKYVVDINGDGYLDIVSCPPPPSAGNTAYYWKIARFNGNAFQTEIHSLGEKDARALVHFFDADEDGLPEILVSSGSQTKLYRNTNGRYSQNPQEGVIPFSSHSYIIPNRVATPSGGSILSVIDSHKVCYYSCPGSHNKRRALTSFIDSFGNSVHNCYGNVMAEDGSYLASSSSIDVSSGFMRYPFPLYVLNQSWTDSGGRITEDSYYLYQDAIVSNRGLGFCGFAKTRVLDNLREETSIQTLAPERLCSISRMEKRKSGSSQLLYSEDYTYDSVQSHGISLPRLSSSNATDYLSSLVTSKSYSYDSYDFPTSVVTVRDNGVGVQKKETLKRTYAHSVTPQKYLLGSVIKESIIREGDGEDTFSWEERTETTLDNKCRPVSQRKYVGKNGILLKEVGGSDGLDLGSPGAVLPPEISPVDPSLEEQPEITDPPLEPGGPGEPDPNRPPFGPDGEAQPYMDSSLYVFHKASFLVEKLRWEYDFHGNVTKEERAPYESEVYIGKTYSYDSEGRYLLSETDALGHTTQYGAYNKFGKPGLITDWRSHRDTLSYDPWGKLIRRAYADGAIEETQTAWGGSGLYTVSKRRTGTPETISHYDALGREILSGEKRFDGTWLWKKSEYDTLGRLSRVSVPYKGDAPAYWNSYVYDDYGRLVSLTEASGKVSTWAYDGASTTSVREGITSTKTVDANGDVAEVSDGGGTISYALRDDRQPSSVTVHGNVVTSFEYDSLGRRMSIIDPSAGIQRDTVAWSADGTSYSVHTGPNGSVTTRFDCYGRTSSVEREGAHNTSYQYDSDGMLLAEISDNACSRRYSYDAFGRVSSVRDTVPDNKWLLREFAYKTGSQIDSIRFSSQDGYITTETFNYANGHNVGIRLPGNTPVWALVSENAEGRVSGIVTGGISRTYGFTPSGLPTYRKMAGGSLQDFSYQFDPMTGNLLSRSDLVNNTLETFAYDTLGRLVAMGPRSISYDAKGNATNIGGVGYLYYGDDSHPYRVTGYSPATPALDAAFDQRAGYTSFNRPSYVSEGGKRADFIYGGDDARVKMQIKRNGWQNLLSRYYIADCYEYDQTSTVTRERLYLGGDAYSAPMVLQRENGGSWTLYNIGRDYLGSITHIATADGALVAEYSYDPWGRQRNPQTQAVYAPGLEPELFLGRGFTGHEHLRDFCLINMNARLYDPVLGRFLSPDPYVQAPEFTQNFNRYSYALNNPLKYTDESGEFVLTSALVIGCIIGGAAIIGGTVNVLSNLENINGFWQGFTTALSGAISGAGVAAVGIFSGGGALVFAGAGAGALTSFNNSLVAQTGENFNGIEQVNWNTVGKLTISGAMAGAVSAYVGSSVITSMPLSFNGTILTSPIEKTVASSLVASAAGHVVGGTTYGMLSGESFEDAFLNSLDGIWQSMAMGVAISVCSTLGTCLFQGINPFDGVRAYPPNNGFKGEPIDDILESRAVIDRYGGTEGKYAATEGTPFSERGLPLVSKTDTYSRYLVVKPIPVQSGEAAGSFWFASPGGGTQFYFLNHNIQYYIDNGYLSPF